MIAIESLRRALILLGVIVAKASAQSGVTTRYDELHCNEPFQGTVQPGYFSKVFSFEVWWQQQHTFSTCDSTFDTTVELYSDALLTTLVAQCADCPASCGAQAVLIVHLDPGTYYVHVRGVNRMENANVHIEVECPVGENRPDEPETATLPAPTTGNEETRPVATGHGHDDGCVCADIWEPVCGVNNVTYGNECEAGCDMQEIACDRECPCGPRPCMCTTIWAPVCSVNNVTYSNRCSAACEKDQVACSGECPCATEATTDAASETTATVETTEEVETPEEDEPATNAMPAPAMETILVPLPVTDVSSNNAVPTPNAVPAPGDSNNAVPTPNAVPAPGDSASGVPSPSVPAPIPATFECLFDDECSAGASTCGVDIPCFQCSQMLCSVSQCPAHPDATCYVSACGGCSTVWINDECEIVNCTVPDSGNGGDGDDSLASDIVTGQPTDEPSAKEPVDTHGNVITACSDETITLECPDHLGVHVLSAYYGREDNTICPVTQWDGEPCEGAAALSASRYRCRGRSSCTLVAADMYLGGSPCPWLEKYLQLEYECVTKPTARPTEAPPAVISVPAPHGVLTPGQVPVPAPVPAVHVPEPAVPVPEPTMPVPEPAVPAPVPAVPVPEPAVPAPESAVPQPAPAQCVVDDCPSATGACGPNNDIQCFHCSPLLCSVSMCPAHPDAACHVSACGGCTAVWVDADCNRVDCAAEDNGDSLVNNVTTPVPVPAPAHVPIPSPATVPVPSTDVPLPEPTDIPSECSCHDEIYHLQSQIDALHARLSDVESYIG